MATEASSQFEMTLEQRFALSAAVMNLGNQSVEQVSQIAIEGLATGMIKNNIITALVNEKTIQFTALAGWLDSLQARSDSLTEYLNKLAEALESGGFNAGAIPLLATESQITTDSIRHMLGSLKEVLAELEGAQNEI
jgi:hypothetical protein